jgi:hypothetical protein
MSSPRTILECKWCKKMCSLQTLKKHHGRKMPRCLAERTYRWMHENEYSLASRSDVRVLELAEIGTVRPFVSWFWRKETVKGKIVHVKEDYTDYTPVFPSWSVKLARRLMTDQGMVTKIGIGKRGERKMTGRRLREAQALGLPEDSIMILPIKFRAKVLRACAASVLTREFAEDDLEAILVMLRDAA